MYGDVSQPVWKVWDPDVPSMWSWESFYIGSDIVDDGSEVISEDSNTSDNDSYFACSLFFYGNIFFILFSIPFYCFYSELKPKLTNGLHRRFSHPFLVILSFGERFTYFGGWNMGLPNFGDLFGEGESPTRSHSFSFECLEWGGSEFSISLNFLLPQPSASNWVLDTVKEIQCFVWLNFEKINFWHYLLLLNLVITSPQNQYL